MEDNANNGRIPSVSHKSAGPTRLTCWRCNAPMHPNWNLLTKEDRDNLKQVFGIKPECPACLAKRMEW